MSEKIEKFSRMGFCGVISDDLRLLWSDQSDIFRKMLSSRSFRAAFQTASSINSFFEHRITFEGIRYRIILLPAPDSRYLCVAYPEECYVKFAYSDMYTRIFNIKRNSCRLLAVLNNVEAELQKNGAPEEYFAFLKEQSDYANEMLADANSVMKLFDKEHMCEYVKISESFGFTYEQVRKYNAMLKREVLFDMKIDCLVARVNFTILEAAVYEIVRLLYRCIGEGGSTVLTITGREDGSLYFSAVAERDPGFDCVKSDREIRDIMCAFECIGGHARIYNTDSRLVIKAKAPASLSNYSARVKNDKSMYYYSKDPDELLKGYSRIFTARKANNGIYEFNCPRVEPEANISLVLADMMLSPISEDYVDPSAF